LTPITGVIVYLKEPYRVLPLLPSHHQHLSLYLLLARRDFVRAVLNASEFVVLRKSCLPRARTRHRLLIVKVNY
jgi:hypothetical protein